MRVIFPARAILELFDGAYLCHLDDHIQVIDISQGHVLCEGIQYLSNDGLVYYRINGIGGLSDIAIY